MALQFLQLALLFAELGCGRGNTKRNLYHPHAPSLFHCPSYSCALQTLMVVSADPDASLPAHAVSAITQSV